MLYRNGIEADSKKIRDIESWLVSRDIKDLRCFLGLTRYHRKFIQDYEKIVKPFTYSRKMLLIGERSHREHSITEGCHGDCAGAKFIDAINTSGVGLGAVLM